MIDTKRIAPKFSFPQSIIYNKLKFSSISSILLILIIGSVMVFQLPVTASETGTGSRAPIKLSGLPEDGKFNYVTLADLNNDGYLDIITGAGGYPGEEPGGLYVYLNQNGKSFKDSSSGLPGPGKDYFGSIQVIDIDKDSNLDIIASYESRWSTGNDKGIGIWFGNGGSGGSMKWTAAKSPVNTGSYDAAYCADINNDGDLDLAGGSSSGIHVWKGQHSKGSLTWTQTSSGLPTTGEFTGVTLGDLNNDGRLDLVAGSYNSRGISVYTCSKSGSISWTEADKDTNLKQSGESFEMTLADLNSDSNLDIIAGIRGGIKIYLGNGLTGDKSDWWTEVSSGLPTSDDYYQMTVADINADGKLDIGSSFQVWTNSGSMSDAKSYAWSTLDIGISESDSIGLTIGDLNNDGNLDIIGCGWGIGVRAYTLILGTGGTPGENKYLLKGTVKAQEDNSLLKGATVRIDTNGMDTITDNSGYFEFNVEEATYELTVNLKDYKSAKKIVIVSGSDITVEIKLTKTSDVAEAEYIVSGRLTDKDAGDPVSDATIILEPGGYSTTTDSDGKYVLTAPNGSYIITVTGSDYQGVTDNIEINGDDVNQDFSLSSTTTENGDGGDDKKEDSSTPFLELPLFIFALISILVILGKFYNKKE